MLSNVWLLAIALTSLILWKLLNLRDQLRYIHVPGPTPLPVLGNLAALRRKGSFAMFAAWNMMYGPVFKVWFGTRLFIVVADVDMAKSVMNKNVNHAPFMSMMMDKHRKIDDNGLVAARDGLWRMVRSAWQPAFSMGSLEGYMGLMDESAQKLAQRLQKAAHSGEPVDLLQELGDMTLQVVGSCAYGVDFGLMDTPDPDQAAAEQHAGRKLAIACKNWFGTTSIMSGSVYNMATVLVPWMGKGVALLAARFPDLPMKLQLDARHTVNNTSEALISSWKAAHGGSPRTMARARGSPAVAPGSFLDLMLSARDKQTGDQLTDIQVLAQAQTFILAGYETTANALAYVLYCVSNNPRVQAKLLQEIDRLPADHPFTPEDLEQLTYTEAVINEALRMFPPAPATTRELKEATRVGPYLLPRGAAMMVPIYAIHHNPANFRQPSSFIPERFLPGYEDLNPCGGGANPTAFLPFGLGPRLCIGYKFAIQEAKSALVRLYQRFTFELLPGQVPLALRSGITLTPSNGVQVRVVQRPIHKSAMAD